MPLKPVKQITQWSYSRYKDWMECPLKAKLKHLDKVPEGPKGAALLRGGEIDKEAELFLKGDIKKAPQSLKLFGKEFLEIRKLHAIPQSKWALDVNWEPLDDFFHPRTWLRVVLDAHYYLPKRKHAVVIDFKTGKIYPDNQNQVELYTVTGFAHYPMAETIEARLWYLDQGEIIPKGDAGVFSRKKHFEPLKKKWRQNVIPMLTDKKFLARPGDYCGRCSFSARRGGPCKY